MATRTEVPAPQIVGWDDSPPASMSSRKSMWDSVIEAVLEREDGLWAKVEKPPKWNSSSLSGLRKKHPELEFVNPTESRGRGAKAGAFIWVRRRVTGEGTEVSTELTDALDAAATEAAAEAAT